MSEAGQRLDKWLWHARFVRTRTAAAGLCATGRVRLDGRSVAKPSQPVRPGHVLTFPQGDRIRVVEVLALAERRGPADTVAGLYRDMSPPRPQRDAEEISFTASPGGRQPGSGRPTKRERRAIDQFRGDEAFASDAAPDAEV